MARKRKADVLHLEDVQTVTDQQKREIEELYSEHCGKIPYAVGAALQRAYKRGQIEDLDRMRFRNPFQEEAKTFLFKFFALGKHQKASKNPDGYIHTAIMNFAAELLEKTLRQEEEFRNSEDFIIQDESTHEEPEWKRNGGPDRTGEELGSNDSLGEAPWEMKTDLQPAEPQRAKPVARTKPHEATHDSIRKASPRFLTLSEDAIRLLQMFAHGELLDICRERALGDAWLEDLAAEYEMTVDEAVELLNDLQWKIINAHNPKRREHKKRTLKFRPLRNVKREEREERSLAEYVASPEWKGASNV